MTLPLEGIRVVDFSWVIAGPFCTQILGLMGAEVIRVESGVHTDVNRRLPPFADGTMGTERSGLWQGLNLNKKSVTLDLRKPEAQELAIELVRRADIALENFAFGQFEKFNLSYERFRDVKPDIIMARSSGLGRWGPYRDYVTFGPPLTAYTGLASITGQAGGRPERWVAGVWTDHSAAITCLFGLLAALEHRDRTGEGQLLEYSMAEAIAAQIPEAFIEYACDGIVPGPRGNQDPGMCPHGVYPSAGDDRWVAIAVQDDDDWRRFRELVPGPAWWRDASLDGVAGRLARRQEIDDAVAAWTGRRPPAEAARLLQEADISAGPAALVEDLLADPNLAARDFYLEHDHPEVGRRTLAGIGWTMPGGPQLEVEHAPLLGEHNWEVLVDFLGLPPERFAALVDLGVIA
jgi:benzylsuccinate CoA-transferase BbsF subunit